MNKSATTTNAFCSTITMNYLAYARTLDESLKSGGNHEPHYVLIVDYRPEYSEIVKASGLNYVTLESLAIPDVDALIEKYRAFEFVNMLKPFFARWLLKNHPEITNLIYLDSDIYVYSDFSELFRYLEDHAQVSVALMPHFHTFEVADEYAKRADYVHEQAHFAFGLYNAGILVFKNDERALRFLDWHIAKVSRYAFNLPQMHMFTDQKVLDMSTIAFDFVGIFRRGGYNVAPWNYIQGLLREQDGKYYEHDKPLVFFHFSRVHKDDPSGSLLFEVSAEDEILYRKLIANYRARLSANGLHQTKAIPYGFNDRYQRQPLPITDLDTTLEHELYETRRWLEIIAKERDKLKQELHSVYSSRSLKLSIYLGKFFTILIPSDRLRRKVILFFWRIFTSIRNVLATITVKLRLLLGKPAPKQARIINASSKKIAFIGHSYHAKTGSTVFLIDYLKSRFEVEVLLDESWQGKPFPDLAHIDTSYLAVIFLQSLPPRHILNNLKHDNVIFVPMYDAVHNWGHAFWRQFANLKIVSFSRTLHNKLVGWGIDSLYLQYFPKPQEFSPGDSTQIFFWQRRTEIDFERIKPLFFGNDVAIHIHQALDPYQKFVQPSTADREAFHITTSDWFETKKQLWDAMKTRAIYIAPREYEGIGMSFLEAMSMGKAVVAIDNPTMNEYIKHNDTGYLFNFAKPKPIDFSNIEQVQKNTYEFMVRGYEQWEKDKEKIIDLIYKS